MKYNEKIIEWQDRTDVIRYTLPIHVSEKNKAEVKSKPRTKYEDMSEKEKAKADKRRVDYFKRRINYVRRLAETNELKLFITLTFREDVTEYTEAKKQWELFLKRFKYKFGNDVKYIATHELQKKRGEVFHFHFLTDIEYIQHTELEKLWGNGFVFIKRMSHEYISYLFKYVTKDVLEEHHTGRSNARKIYCSRSLEKPVVTRRLSEQPVEDIIFDNLETIENSYIYPLRNYQDIQINEAECLVIKKK